MSLVAGMWLGDRHALIGSLGDSGLTVDVLEGRPLP